MEKRGVNDGWKGLHITREHGSPKNTDHGHGGVFTPLEPPRTDPDPAVHWRDSRRSTTNCVRRPREVDTSTGPQGSRRHEVSRPARRKREAQGTHVGTEWGIHTGRTHGRRRRLSFILRHFWEKRFWRLLLIHSTFSLSPTSRIQPPEHKCDEPNNTSHHTYINNHRQSSRGHLTERGRIELTAGDGSGILSATTTLTTSCPGRTSRTRGGVGARKRAASQTNRAHRFRRLFRVS